jgi:hypothetical protein
MGLQYTLTDIELCLESSCYHFLYGRTEIPTLLLFAKSDRDLSSLAPFYQQD